MKRRWPDVAIALLLAAVTLLVYRRVTRLWWTWDDPFHLNLIRTRGLGELLFGRGLWHGFPSHVFTPLLLASLKLDLALFGLAPRGFYVHQLLAGAAVVVLVYAALRAWTQPLVASLAAITVALSPAFAETIPQLMVRHYFEGLVLALLALIAMQRERPLLSAAFYFAAMGEKEVFVPLIVIFAVAYGVRRVIPHAGALALYALWRAIVAGPSLHGYGWAARRGQWPEIIATMPLRVFDAATAHGGTTAIVLVVAVLALVAALTRRQWPLAVTAAAAMLLPIVPVSIEVHTRYVLVAWTAAVIGAALLAQRWRYGVAAMTIITLLAIGANRVSWPAAYRDAKRMSDEDRALPQLAANDLLYLPLTPPATLAETAALTGAKGRWTYDPLPLCAHRITPARVLGYDHGSVHDLMPSAVTSSCTTTRLAPLTVAFEHESDMLFWSFGPYARGTYRVVIADGASAFDVPRQAGFSLPGVPQLPVRVRYESPDGWTTYSPDVTLDLTKPSHYAWRR